MSMSSTHTRSRPRRRLRLDPLHVGGAQACVSRLHANLGSSGRKAGRQRSRPTGRADVLLVVRAVVRALLALLLFFFLPRLEAPPRAFLGVVRRSGAAALVTAASAAAGAEGGIGALATLTRWMDWSRGASCAAHQASPARSSTRPRAWCAVTNQASALDSIARRHCLVAFSRFLGGTPPAALQAETRRLLLYQC